MQLHDKYGERVIGISLNVDFNGGSEGPSEQLQSEIVSLLTDLGITCQNVISSEPMDEVLKSFELFGLPAVLVYNRQGQLHKRFEGTVSYREHVFPEVEQLLGSSP